MLDSLERKAHHQVTLLAMTQIGANTSAPILLEAFPVDLFDQLLPAVALAQSSVVLFLVFFKNLPSLSFHKFYTI